MTRQLVTIGEHTIDVSLLHRHDWVLDAGCRDFTFARGIVERGPLVLAVDADPTVQKPNDYNIVYHNVAIAAECGDVSIVMTTDPQARHLDGLYHIPAQEERRTVSAFTVEQLRQCCHFIGADTRFAAVKLDVEGAEYEILRRWPGPIARQISVEFHEHCAQRPPSLYDEILGHLAQWYEVVQHEKSVRHCLPPNWWDTLLILKAEYLS